MRMLSNDEVPRVLHAPTWTQSRVPGDHSYAAHIGQGSSIHRLTAQLTSSPAHPLTSSPGLTTAPSFGMVDAPLTQEASSCVVA